MSRKRVEIPATSISCQLTAEERDALTIVAKQLDKSSVAELVRFCILETCGNELEAAVDFLLPSAERDRSKITVSVPA